MQEKHLCLPPYFFLWSRSGSPSFFILEWPLVAHAPYVAHWMLRSGALHPFVDQKVSHSYSLILVILFFLHVLLSKDNLTF